MARVKEKEAPKQHQEESTHESLEVAAYFNWLERGCPMGDDLTDWVEVERKYTSNAQHN
jgi:hypothetical protein